MEKAVRMIENSNGGDDEASAVTIGGGEPTLHKHFMRLLGRLICSTHICSSSSRVWLATNGTNTNISLKLARMAESGIIGVALSLDHWHNPRPHESVQRAFTRSRNTSSSDTHDYREIREIPEPVAQGRGAKVGDRHDCVCSCVMVKPDGTLRYCGCDNAPVIGNVSEGVDPKFKKLVENHSGEFEPCWNYLTAEEQQRKKINKDIDHSFSNYQGA